jgi:hypothetical protein
MRLSNETKVFIGITIGTLLLVFAAIFFLSRPAKQAEALPKSSLILDTTHIKGEASASAYLVEFSDFQCPACKAIQPYVEQILSTYKDSLLFAYRHYPLPQHHHKHPHQTIFVNKQPLHIITPSSLFLLP